MSDVTQHKDKSTEWLQWRNQGIGSSDAAVILGVSPYSTPYQLWEQKTGKQKKEDKMNWAMNRGNELEPVARAKYELLTGLEMKARLFEHYEHRFMRASFDGYNADDNKGIEIKFQGKEAHESGIVPDKYYPQIQHQLFCSGAESIDFVSYNPKCEPDMIIINVKPDINWLKDYFTSASNFWQKNVLGDTPPELTDKDIQVVPDLAGLSQKYINFKKTLKETEDAMRNLEEQIFEIVKDKPKVQFGSIKITRVWRKGNINYKAVPELAGLDLDKFRSAPSVSHRIST